LVIKHHDSSHGESALKRSQPRIAGHEGLGRHGDRSTAVVGGLGPFEPSLIGIKETEELPQGLYGSARASALMAIDRRFYSDALIVADLSNDAMYAEVLHETLGASYRAESRPRKFQNVDAAGGRRELFDVGPQSGTSFKIIEKIFI
jgi:hypothetical protein